MNKQPQPLSGHLYVKKAIIAASCGALLISMISESVADDENIRLYRTRAEKREAGVKHQWTPWLSTSSLAELEWVSERFKGAPETINIEETIATLQLAAKVEPVEYLVGELVLEYDTEIDEIKIDEGALELEREDWQLAAGKYYLPFGEYYSSFITDPILQVGEVRAYAVTLSYDLPQDIEVSAFGYRSIYDEKAEFGFSLESEPSDNILFKFGYINEFNATDEFPADDPNVTVPALTGHVLWLTDNHEISFEVLGAIKSFSNSDTKQVQPWALNLEYTYIPHPRWDLTVRIEGSHDIDGAPKIQYGLALNARLHKNVTLGIEALHGRFANNLDADDEDAFDHVNTLSAQLVIAF